MNETTILDIKDLVTRDAPVILGHNLKKAILFGSCARGDYNDDSDVDVALIVSRDDDCKESAMDIVCEAMARYGAVLSFSFVREQDYESKKSWYPFYRNINNEGVIWYAS